MNMTSHSFSINLVSTFSVLFCKTELAHSWCDGWNYKVTNSDTHLPMWLIQFVEFSVDIKDTWLWTVNFKHACPHSVLIKGYIMGYVNYWQHTPHTNFQTEALSHKKLCIQYTWWEKKTRRERERKRKWETGRETERKKLEKDREPSSSPGFRTRWTLLQNLASRHPNRCQGPPALSWVSSCRR